MSKKVLIIEDDRTLLEMYKIKFTAKGFDVSGATTGEEGLKIAFSQKFDLILVDLKLINKIEGGRIDGFEVIEKFKKNGNTKEAKIYALSNLDQEKEIERAYKLGADGYLVKSDLTPSELVAAVGDIFNGKEVGIKIKK